MPHLALALAVLCAVSLMVVLEGSIVAVALPAIQNDLRFTPSILALGLLPMVKADGNYATGFLPTLVLMGIGFGAAIGTAVLATAAVFLRDREAQEAIVA